MASLWSLLCTILTREKKSDIPAKTILTVECLLKAVEHKSLGTERAFERNWSRDS